MSQKLMITDLNQGNGYTILQLGEIQLIQNYSKILHIFKIEEYLTYINKLESEIMKLNDAYLQHQIEHSKLQLLSIIPRYRVKRGLINLAGKGLKYLYGTMDDDDRKEIEEKLKINTINNHNLIEQSNKQIKINTHFDEQLKSLTDLQNQQTKLLAQNMYFINRTRTDSRKAYLRYEIEHLGKLVEQARELLLASKLRTLNRDILTDQEIIDFNITLYKLENIELDVATKESDIIFIIKVPNLTTETYKEIFIQPIPNKNGQEIMINANNYLTDGKNMYENTNKLSKLRKINDKCIQNIFRKDKMICNYHPNNSVNIIEIGSNVMVTTNVDIEIKQTCNQFPFTLKGHYLIYIENCKILLDKWYSKQLYQNTVIIPNPFRTIEISNDTNLSLRQLEYKHINNTNIITELKTNQKIHNYTTYTILTIIIITICICLYIKNKKTVEQTAISVNLPSLPSEPGISSLSGGVITSSTQRLPFA